MESAGKSKKVSAKQKAARQRFKVAAKKAAAAVKKDPSLKYQTQLKIYLSKKS